MKSLNNNVRLFGNLGKDVELFSFDSGSKKASFSLATNDYYKNKDGERVQETTWHNVVAWGNLAEIMANVLSKGNRVMISGKITNRSYEDNQGATRYVSEILTNDFLKVHVKEKEEVPF